MIKGRIDESAVKMVERYAWCQSADKGYVDDMLADGHSYEEIRQELSDAYVTLKAMISAIGDELEETGTALDYLRHKQFDK